MGYSQRGPYQKEKGNEIEKEAQIGEGGNVAQPNA